MESGARTGRAAGPETSSGADGVPGRFPPGEIRGARRDAERLAPYWLIAPLSDGKRVLDVGCGNGEGCEILACAGARAVVGVDQREAVLEAARPKMPESVRLERVDPVDPRLPDEDFDLVTCFGPGGADELPGRLDELVSALSPGGIIAISLPDPDSGAARADARPTAADLEQELARRLANVRLYRRRAWTASAMVEGESLDSPPDGEIPASEVRTLATGPRSEQSSSVAVASEVPIPRLPLAIVLADHGDESRWAEAAERQQAVIEAQSARIEELESVAAGSRELRRSLVDAEQELAELPELRRRSDELERLQSASRIAAAVEVPVERARGLWLPSLRHSLKLLLERAVGFLRSS